MFQRQILVAFFFHSFGIFPLLRHVWNTQGNSLALLMAATSKLDVLPHPDQG